MKKFPETIYVVQEQDESVSWFEAYDVLADAISTDTRRVGVYTLARVGEARLVPEVK